MNWNSRGESVKIGFFRYFSTYFSKTKDSYGNIPMQYFLLKWSYVHVSSYSTVYMGRYLFILYSGQNPEKGSRINPSFSEINNAHWNSTWWETGNKIFLGEGEGGLEM